MLGPPTHDTQLSLYLRAAGVCGWSVHGHHDDIISDDVANNIDVLEARIETAWMLCTSKRVVEWRRLQILTIRRYGLELESVEIVLCVHSITMHRSIVEGVDASSRCLLLKPRRHHLTRVVPLPSRRGPVVFEDGAKCQYATVLYKVVKLLIIQPQFLSHMILNGRHNAILELVEVDTIHQLTP